MGPKKARVGESSHAASTYDRRRFVSEDASIRFSGFVESKTLIPERGLRPDPAGSRLYDMITERNWINFTAQPEPAVISIVREFYANAHVTSNAVRVRGKIVSFTKAAINAYYGIEDKNEDDGLTQYRAEGVNLEAIIRGLCRPDAEWVIRDGQPRHFSPSHLSRYGKAWYYFICAKLLPTTHVSDVIRVRAVMLYCVVNDKSIDVGRIINASIRSAIEGGTSGGLPHPSLITALCQQAGVEWAADEPVQPPKVLIDARLIRNYNQWDGAPADLKGAGFVLAVPSPDSDEFFADPTPPAADASPSLASLTSDVRRLQRESRRQTRRIDHVSQQMTSMMQYNASFTQTLAQMFERAGLNAGPDPLHFPVYPDPPILPPDSPDSDA